MFTFRRHGHKLLFGDILVVLARYTTCNTAREVQYCTVRDLPFPCPNSDCARAQSDLRNMTHSVSRPLHTESVHKKGYRFLAGCKIQSVDQLVVTKPPFSMNTVIEPRI